MASVVNDYRNQLLQLRSNHLPQINLLTMLAEDMKKTAHLVVNAIEMHLKTCSASQRILTLYVVDSILKNTQNHEYRVLFSQKIVAMFEYIFGMSDDSTRFDLYNLRITWGATGRFLPSKLYALDMKINRMDNAWPIANPKTIVIQKEESGALKRKSPTYSEPTEHSEVSAKVQKVVPNMAEIASILAKVSPPKVAQAPPTTAVKKEDSKEAVLSLLRNLQKSGILKSSESKNGAQKEEVIDYTSLALDFSLLKMRKSSVVNSLLTKRLDSCKVCGLKLDDSQGKSKLYQDHMDYHVRVNLGIEKSKSAHRQWYPTAASWLSANPEITVAKPVEKVDDNLGVESTGQKVKDCSVCGEQFQEYYNDDDETWRFKDTVMGNGMIVHSGCASDAQNVPNENFLAEVKQERSSDFDFAFF